MELQTGHILREAGDAAREFCLGILLAGANSLPVVTVSQTITMESREVTHSALDRIRMSDTDLAIGSRPFQDRELAHGM